MCFGTRYKYRVRYTSYYLKDVPKKDKEGDKKDSKKKVKKKEDEPDRHFFVHPNDVFYRTNNPLAAPIITTPITGIGPLQNTTPDPNNPQSVQFMPYQQSNEDQFWCQELDGGFTLRPATEIAETCGPGRWAISKSGWPYFIRARPSTSRK